MTRSGIFQSVPSLIKKDDFKFLIMDAPTDQNLQKYIDYLKRYNIQTLVRTCEATYATDILEKAGIKVVDIRFCDSEPPSRKVVKQWLDIVKNENIINNCPVAVHCVAGLGRSPLLVAIALIRYAKMTAIESVELIRNVRRGAFTQNQLHYLKKFESCHCQEKCVVL